MGECFPFAYLRLQGLKMRLTLPEGYSPRTVFHPFHPVGLRGRKAYFGPTGRCSASSGAARVAQPVSFASAAAM